MDRYQSHLLDAVSTGNVLAKLARDGYKKKGRKQSTYTTIQLHRRTSEETFLHELILSVAVTKQLEFDGSLLF